MHDDTLLSRITADPEIFGGKPTVRGMRISVELILSLLAQGQTIEAILDDYPELEADDVRACLAYAHSAIADESINERDGNGLRLRSRKAAIRRIQALVRKYIPDDDRSLADELIEERREEARHEAQE